MKFRRRELFRLAGGAAALPLLTRTAAAVDFPTRPVHIITPYPPGAGPDARKTSSRVMVIFTGLPDFCDSLMASGSR